MNSMDVAGIVVIPDTPDRVSKKEKNICQDTTISPHLKSTRDDFFGDNMHTSKVNSNYRVDFGDNDQSYGINSIAAPLLSNAPTLVTAAKRDIKFKGKYQSNHPDVEDSKISHSRFPEMSYHHYNRCVVPMFDRCDVTKASKDDLSLHAPVVSWKSSRSEDKGKVKIGNDVPVDCDAYLVKRNDEGFHVGLERTAGERLSVPLSFTRGTNAIKNKRLVRNGCISPKASKDDLSLHAPVVSWKSSRSEDMGKVKFGNDVPVDCDAYPVKRNDEGFHVGLDRTAGERLSVPLSFTRGTNAIKSKRLVRNGCISPHNIAKAKISAESSSVSSHDECNGVSGGSPCVINVDKVIANENTVNRSKGKEVMIHRSSLDGHEDRRADTRLNDSIKIVLGKRTAPSALELVPVLDDDEVCTPGVSKSEKKLGSCSSSQEENKEIICLSSGGKSSVAISTMDHHAHSRRDLDSPIVVGDFSPEVRARDPQVDNDNETRARQLQADELMARELQEQLYNEMLEAPNGEIGARPSNTRRGSQFPSFRNRLPLPRGLSPNIARLRDHIVRHASMAASGRRGRFFPSGMDIDMRMELLEALEAVDNDVRTDNQLIHSNREFNEHDYEMLLSLDENNHVHLGASAAQIANLPESTMQSDDTEVCSVCLETPVIGDTMRHLRCLHKFHKDCIDTWLRRKRSCPICKSDI